MKIQNANYVTGLVSFYFISCVYVWFLSDTES